MIELKLIIYDDKLDSESCFFTNIKSQIVLNWFIELIKEIPFKEFIFCTDQIDRARQFIEARLRQRPNIQIVNSIKSSPNAIVLKANYIYDKRKLIKLIKKGNTNLSAAILWQIRGKNDIKYAEETLERIKMFPVARQINLKLGKKLANFLVKSNITPNQVTFVSLIAGLLACFCFASGIYALAVVGAFLLQLHCTLDFSDGHLARLKDAWSRSGAFLDGITNMIVEALCYVGISYGLFLKHNNKFFLVTGLSVIFGHFMIEHVNFLKMKYLKTGSIDIWKIGNKELPFKILKKIYWFLEAWDVRLYIISLFAILNRLEFPMIYFVIDFNARWIFNTIKVIVKQNK